MVKNKRIINLIPRGVQTSTIAYGILPPPIEIANSIKLSSEVKRAEATTLKDQLEFTVKTYNLRLIKHFYEKLGYNRNSSLKDMGVKKIYTSLMDERIGK